MSAEVDRFVAWIEGAYGITMAQWQRRIAREIAQDFWGPYTRAQAIITRYPLINDTPARRTSSDAAARLMIERYVNDFVIAESRRPNNPVIITNIGGTP